MMRRENRIVNGKIILDDTYSKQEIWDNKHARCLFNFPINDPVKTGKAPTRLSDPRVQINRAAIIPATWLDTHPVADVALFPYTMSALKQKATSIFTRERHRRGCAAYPLTTLRK